MQLYIKLHKPFDKSLPRRDTNTRRIALNEMVRESFKDQLCKEEHRKASMRSKVEQLFRVIKRQFGPTKVRFRGLHKNTGHPLTLFALSSLCMARRSLMAMMGVVRPNAA